MSPFNHLNLLGRTYIDGEQDCYSLVRSYYKEAFGIVLPNYARPAAFDHGGVNLIGILKANPDYQLIPTDRMEFQVGDVLTFNVASTFENHFGVYVGNDLFIHHLYKRVSEESNLDQRWFRRLVSVLRHNDVVLETKVDIWDFIPQHVREKYNV